MGSGKEGWRLTLCLYLIIREGGEKATHGLAQGGLLLPEGGGCCCGHGSSGKDVSELIRGHTRAMIMEWREIRAMV